MKNSLSVKLIVGLLLVAILVAGCGAPAAEEAPPPEEPAIEEEAEMEQLFVGYALGRDAGAGRRAWRQGGYA